MKIYGIDVSHHQGRIDWQKTAAELRRVNMNAAAGFALLRAGYSARSGLGGLIRDGQFTNNMAGCEANGVPMGVYFYCYDMSVAAARRTAKEVAQLLKGHRFGYPIYYDVEYEPYNRTCGKAQNTAMILAALEELESAGFYAAVYCSRDFFINYTNLGSLVAFDKWEAAYTATDTDTVKNGLWQYGSKNQLGIAGFGNSLDCNVSYVDYPAIMAAKGLNGYRMQAQDNPCEKLATYQLALEILAGKWGNGAERRDLLTAAGYNYAVAQAAVNAIVAKNAQNAAKPALDKVEEVAKQVIRGEWGNGTNRRNRLMAAGYNYDEIQQAVNDLLNK